MPERQYDAWRVYTERDPHIQQIGDGINVDLCRRPAAYWNTFLPRLVNLTSDREGRSTLQDTQIGYGALKSYTCIKMLIYTYM